MVTLYHGSDVRFDIVKPWGVNMGAIGEKPRWSSYFWDEKHLAISWAIFQTIRRNTNVKTYYHIPTGKAIVNARDTAAVNGQVIDQHAYLYVCSVPENEVGFGSSPEINEFTVDRDVKPDRVDTIMITGYHIDKHVLYMNDNEISTYLREHESGKYAYARGDEYKGVLDPTKDQQRHKAHHDVELGRLSPGDPLDDYSQESYSSYAPKEHPHYPGWFVSEEYPYFAVSMNGTLKNVQTGYETKGSKDDRGYFRACIWDNESGKKRDVKVHRVVCTAFHGPPPGPNFEVGHKNDVRSDNVPSNLEWVTRLDNMRRANERRRMANRHNVDNAHKDMTLEWL